MLHTIVVSLYLIIVTLVWVTLMVTAFRTKEGRLDMFGQREPADADDNAWRVFAPFLVGAVWPLLAGYALMRGAFWALGAVIRAAYFRRHREEDRKADQSE